MPTGPPPVYAVSTDRKCSESNKKKKKFSWNLWLLVADNPRMDRLGEELAEDSDIWLTYVNTATVHDTEMIDGWNKSLDVLLIFVCSSIFSIPLFFH